MLLNLKAHVASAKRESLQPVFSGGFNRAAAETSKNLQGRRDQCSFTTFAERRKQAATYFVGQVLRTGRYINISLHFIEIVAVTLQTQSQGSLIFLFSKDQLDDTDSER